MVSPIDTSALEQLLRGFYTAYRERFEELAGTGEDESPMPYLATRSLDLVRVNGGRALHFFFTEPPDLEMALRRRVTRVHDIELWPATTEELKAREDEEPDTNREQVRRTADIDDEVYVHFIVYPEDGRLMQILTHVAGLVAEREVTGGSGPVSGRNVFEDEEDAPVRAFDAGPQDVEEAADDWLHPDR